MRRLNRGLQAASSLLSSEKADGRRERVFPAAIAYRALAD